MTMIYHITTAADWLRQADSPVYEADSLTTEGFIHLSTADQVAGVLDRYYPNRSDLLLLHVDPARLLPDLKYEVSTNADLFPHLYGPLNKSAVMRVEQLPAKPIP